jgi:hypothetical protein
VHKAVQEGPAQTREPEDCDSLFDGGIGSCHEARTPIGTADHFKQLLSSCPGKRHVPQFISYQE